MSALGSSLEKRFKKIFWKMVGSRTPRGTPPPLKPGQALSVLALRPDRLGDFILSVPALRELQSSLGFSSRLTLVAGERNAETARFFFPDAGILVFKKSIPGRMILFFRLWISRYDAVIDFHSFPFSTTSALMAMLSGSARRVGFLDQGDFSPLSRRVFNLGAPPPGEAVHEKNKSLLLVKRLFPRGVRPTGDHFYIPSIPMELQKRVELFYQTIALRAGDRIIGFHPTLKKTDNRWRPEKYIELVRKFRGNNRMKFILIHGKGEEEELKRFLKAMGNFSNVFTLPEIDVLFILDAAKKLDLFVGGDSGLTHLAALVTRVLAVFGPSDPRRWGPLTMGHGSPVVLRKPDRLCDSVTVDEVEKEIKKILKQGKSRSRVWF